MTRASGVHPRSQFRNDRGLQEICSFVPAVEENVLAHFPPLGLVTTVIVAALAACTVSTTTGTVPVETDVAIVRVAPPPPRYEVVPPLPPERFAIEYWQPGHWRWNEYEHVWVPGHYAVRPRAGAVWVPGHWQQRGAGWVFIEGHWA
jgi:hypothetical protein